MRHCIQIVMLIGLFCWNVNAHAKCDLSITGLSNRQSAVLDADTIHQRAVTKTVNFMVENRGTTGCYYFLTIDPGVAGDINFQRRANITHALPAVFQQANREYISYQLYSEAVRDNTVITTLDQAVFNQNVLGPRYIRPRESLSDQFLIHVPAQALPNLIAESYADEVSLTLYQHSEALIDFAGDCPNCTEEARRTLNFQFNLTDYVTLSIGNAYNPNRRQAKLDFGELESGAEDSFVVYAGGRTNSGSACSVTISSAQGAKMVRKDVVGKVGNRDVIPYSLVARGGLGSPTVVGNIDVSTPNTAVPLATSSTPFICGNNPQGMMSIDVDVKIGDVEGKAAGVYQDTLTVEVMIGL